MSSCTTRSYCPHDEYPREDLSCDEVSCFRPCGRLTGVIAGGRLLPTAWGLLPILTKRVHLLGLAGVNNLPFGVLVPNRNVVATA